MIMKDIDVEDAVQNQNQENENLEEAQEEQGKPEVVEDKEDSLESKLAIAEKQAAEMQDAFLRAKAEGENIRRRAQEDIAKAHKFAIENFAQSMVAVKDSLEMAMKTDVPSVDSIKEGVDATLRQLKQVFEQNKIFEVVPEQGEKLDPMKHQAIQMVESDQDPNTIVSVLQKGYTLADRLLRPAVVVVAAPKSLEISKKVII